MKIELINYTVQNTKQLPFLISDVEIKEGGDIKVSQKCHTHSTSMLADSKAWIDFL
jgi:hypothetical protein